MTDRVRTSNLTLLILMFCSVFLCRKKIKRSTNQKGGKEVKHWWSHPDRLRRSGHELKPSFCSASRGFWGFYGTVLNSAPSLCFTAIQETRETSAQDKKQQGPEDTVLYRVLFLNTSVDVLFWNQDFVFFADGQEFQRDERKTFRSSHSSSWPFKGGERSVLTGCCSFDSSLLKNLNLF